MNVPKFLLIALSSFFLVHSQTNLFENPSFEQDASGGWGVQTQNSTSALLEFTATAARTGEKGAQITVSAISAENWHVQLNTPTQWDAVSGQKYRISFYARANGNLPIHVAIQDGPPDYTYRKGFDFSLNNTEWKSIEVNYTSDAAGTGAVRFNIYVGGATGVYFFDDFSLETVVEVNPGEITLPANGAFETGIYRNMFQELGKSEAEIDAKIDLAFMSLFHGDEQNERIYFESGSDMGFIKAIDSDDIRSEGLSYGMMIAVQLNKKDEFDRIWNFSKTHVQYQNGPRKGFFSWNVDPNSFSVNDSNSAPDGEEYFAMALFFASHRWGDGEGIYNYSAEANQILHYMLHLEEENGGVVNGLVNMFNSEEKKVVFVPKGDDATYTDASYHLPAFYKLWSEWAIQDKDFWSAAADTSREFLLRAMHETTALTTDYSTFEGQPKQTSFNSNSHRFAYDSWRVGMNIGFDCHWFGNDGWQPQQNNKLLNFFAGQGMGSYKTLYEQDGTPLAENNYHSTGLVATNAAATLGASDSIAWGFVSELWETPVPTGTYRYYDGMLYMLGMLHTSGKFRIWQPETYIGKSVPAQQNQISQFKVTMQKSLLEVSFLDPDNKTVTISLFSPLGQLALVKNIKADAPRISIDCSNLAGGLYYVSVRSDAKNLVRKVIVK